VIRPTVSAQRAAYQQVLGEHLRGLRKRSGLRGSELMRWAGVSSALVSKVEKGFRGPSAESLAALCDALEVDMLDLLAEVGEAHRRACNPDGAVIVSAYLRRMDGLALFAGFPNGCLPGGPVELPRSEAASI
jgi:transcriptional regulator with XRE-family HTH domain